MNVSVLVSLVILVCFGYCLYTGELIEIIPFVVIGFLYFIFKIFMFFVKKIAKKSMK